MPAIALPQRKIKRYGWKPDIPDRRDAMFAAPPELLMNPPLVADLQPQCPPVYDQGQLGSCTANGVAFADQFDQMKQGLQAFTPSRLFIYWFERYIEGTTGEDSGAQIRDGITVLARMGAPPEDMWPYSDQGDQFAQEPPADVQAAAKPHHALQYARVAQTASQIMATIAAGFPIVFGFTVYESFESPEVAQTGMMPVPGPGEQILGGHCVAGVGYDSTRRMVKCRNSWGDGWGLGGYFWMPFAVLTDRTMASDLWVIRRVS